MKKLYILLLTVFISFSIFAAGNSFGDDDKVRCYPNPASTVINFSFTGKYESGHTITIYNSIGKKVSEQSLISSRISVGLDGYFRGIYLYQLKDKAGKIIQTGRFQVSK